MTKTQSNPPKSADQILPHQLPSALQRAPDAVKLLSLDCFDTLLWRDVHAPSDLFSALPDVMVQQRVAAEANARKAMLTRRRRNEVGLQDIYAQAFPELGRADRREERDAAIQAELSAEAQTCFAFTPTVELMQEAKARGLKVIIVSDTYLSASELRALIKASAGGEVLALIDRIFVSSEAGFSKAEGLLGHALKAMKMRAHQTLHIGDNPKADYDGARALGIPALHLVQFEETARQRLRLERACAQLTGEMAGQETPALEGLQPHRAILALEEPRVSDPAERLGFTVLGPLMAAYERWLRREAQALAEKHDGTVHWLFMMRDGHLPHLVHQAFNEATSEAPPSSARIEISRFTATAASLTSRAAYDEQVALEFGLNPSTLARQMLLAEDEIEAIVGDPRNDSELVDASFRLLDALKDGKQQKTTMRRARQMAERMVAHVKANLNIAPGDVLMLVDLGYNGSAQNGVDALLSEALGVHVAGRYLLCREKTVSGLDKTGMLDPQH
ncbi:MAG: HAD family hydrolase, partial [Pseudomonadota bacterium]